MSPGIAIGSLGQYLEDATVENVEVRDVKVGVYNPFRLSSHVLTFITR